MGAFTEGRAVESFAYSVWVLLGGAPHFDLLLWGAPFGGLLPEPVLLHSYCSFFFCFSPLGNLSGFSSYVYERVENSSLHLEGALSFYVPPLESAPPFGLLLGSKLFVDLLRYDAPPTVQ